MNNNFNFKKYGKPTRSNIKWGYNFDPLKKISLTILSIIFLISFGLFVSERKKEAIIPISIESSEPEIDSEISNEIKALEGILKSIQADNKGQSNDIYVWNENGKTKASNINYPVKNKSLKVIEGVSAVRETKYIKQGGSILIPVVIGNKGKAYQVNMILDTGCSITLLDAEVSKALSFKSTGRITTSMADGSRSEAVTGEIDHFEVGPYKEQNFFISTNNIAGNNKTQHGLLGMNFLEKHPFTIDHKRQVIVWQ